MVEWQLKRACKIHFKVKVENRLCFRIKLRVLPFGNNSFFLGMAEHRKIESEVLSFSLNPIFAMKWHTRNRFFISNRCSNSYVHVGINGADFQFAISNDSYTHVTAAAHPFVSQKCSC